MEMETSTLIDLRSDTITKPSPEMRRAIAEAEVGDDVFGDDPTVRQLERRVAEILGKEAAVYVASGTMANQVAVRSHTEPGNEIIADENAHIYYYEAGGTAALSGVIFRLLQGKRGIFSASDLEAALRPTDQHFAPTRLVCLENTHNRGGGSVWPLETTAEVAALARERGLRLHLDGARIWNATAATGISEAEYASHFDSISVCFSKGLGAPVGSALAGDAAFIERARRFRKQFGGGMRQAGLIAAGALYALEHNRQRLADDHANAQALAQGLTEIPGIELDVSEVETNLVFFRPLGDASAPEFAERCDRAGVRMLALGPDMIRAVTNLMVAKEDIPQALKIIREIMTS